MSEKKEKYANRKTFRNMTKYMDFCYLHKLTKANSFQEYKEEGQGFNKRYYVVLHYNKTW